MGTRLLAFSATPRARGNSRMLLDAFLAGAGEAGNELEMETVETEKLDLLPCRGCLRCNLLKRCVIRKDCWPKLSRKIIAADILLFATPIYFHHTTASCKKLIDRFRSFVHVQITESGLVHTPHTPWNKDIVLLATLGSSSDADARPLIDLFAYMQKIMGRGNRLHVICGTRLATAGQIALEEQELERLYERLELPVYLAKGDAARNRELLQEAACLGQSLISRQQFIC